MELELSIVHSPPVLLLLLPLQIIAVLVVMELLVPVFVQSLPIVVAAAVCVVHLPHFVPLETQPLVYLALVLLQVRVSATSLDTGPTGGQTAIMHH